MVSVIIPSYNHCAYIKQAIDSVLDQTFSDFELLIIDDASTDGSHEVIREFDDPRITYWAKETNSGSAATINEAIRLAQGKYISILNSDDFYHPQRLELLVNDCEQNNIRFAATDIELVDADGHLIFDKGHWWIEWFEKLKSYYVATNDIFQGLLQGNFFITTSNFFIRRDVFAHIGFFYEYEYVLDYEFILRFLSFYPQDIKFWLDAKLLSYRLHGMNTIRKDPVAANKETHQILLKWFAQYLNWQDRVRFQALAQQLGKCLGHVEEETHRVCTERYHQFIEEKHADNQQEKDLISVKDQQIQKQQEINKDLQNELDKRMEWIQTLQSKLDKKQEEIQSLGDSYSALASGVLELLARWRPIQAPGRDNTLVEMQEIQSAGRNSTENENAFFGGETKEYIDAMDQLITQWRDKVWEKEEDIVLIRASLSYRLGHALLFPARLVRKVLTGKHAGHNN